MPGIGIGIGINNRRIIGKPAAPTGLSASFTVDTISGDLSWTDNTGGVAQYEIYSSYNGKSYVYLGTTTAGARRKDKCFTFTANTPRQGKRNL